MSLEVVNDWELVPVFASIAEEVAFWQTHQAGLRLMQSSLVGTDSNESTTITLLKRLARQRYLNYQSMLKQWVAERLEKELD